MSVITTIGILLSVGLVTSQQQCIEDCCPFGVCLPQTQPLSEIQIQELALELYPGLFTDLCSARIELVKLEFRERNSPSIIRKKRGTDGRRDSCCGT